MSSFTVYIFNLACTYFQLLFEKKLMYEVQIKNTPNYIWD